MGLSSLAAFSLSLHGADLSKYRDFRLGMPVAEVVKQSGAAEANVKIISSRPERVEELEWRIGWTPPSSDVAQVPFTSIAFEFYKDALYQISVSYDRDRTRGLTANDMVESISSLYGTATPVSDVRTPDTIARWEDSQADVSLVRLPYFAGFGLVLSSKATRALAEQAIVESDRLNRIDAPRVEAARQAKQSADAQTAEENARSVNKPRFRP